MRRIALAIAALLIATTAACGGDDESSLPPAGATSASASPSPSATASATWAVDAKPQRPADDLSEDGARAFTRFAADTVLYMMATGDAPALAEISDLSTCASCKTWADNHADGKINKLTIGTGPTTYELAEPPTVTDEVFYRVVLEMDIPKGRSVRKDSKKKIDDIPAAQDLPFVADITWKDDQWLLLRFEMG